MAHYVVGIDSAASGIKVSVLDASLRGVELRRAETVPWQMTELPSVDTPPEEVLRRSPETALAQQIAEVCKRLELGGAELYLGWDGNKSSTRVLSFPLGDLRKIDAMLDFELEDQLASKLDEIVYTHIPVAVSKEKTDILVATTERAPVEAFLNATVESGFSPRSLFLESSSLLALCGPVPTGMIVDIGHTKTHVIVVQNGKPLFSRTLREGGRRVDQAISKATVVDEDTARAQKERSRIALPHEEPEDAVLAKAIHAGLRSLVVGLKQTLLPYLVQLGPAPQVFLTGGMSQFAGIDRYLTSELGADTQLLPLPPALAALPDGHRYAMSYALAITGAQSARHPRLDFRVGGFSFRGDMSGLAMEGQRWAMGIVIILALAFTAGISRYVVLRSDENKLDDALKQVTKTMMGREMSDFKQAITAIRQSVNPEKSALPRFSALDYFGIVSSRIAPDVDVKLMELELRQDKILMKGEGANFEMVDKAVEGLKGHECFKQVVPGKTRKTADGLRVEFSVQIDLSCGNT